MLSRQGMTIDSVEPTEGREGTIVTIKGSGFGRHPRSNCIVVGDMGACLRVLPGGSDTEIRGRIDPVARPSKGEILAWPGLGAELHSDIFETRRTALDFVEIAIFKNGAPQTRAPVEFALTEASPDTFGGELHSGARKKVDLGGYERGNCAVATIPGDFDAGAFRSVDICCVLKEPTTTLDFTAELADGERDTESALHAIARAITLNFRHLGIEVYADVARHGRDGDFELYVTKPHLERSMLTIHFSKEKARSSVSMAN